MCNFALRKTADDNQIDFDEDAVSVVKRNFYVDDCLKSCHNDQEAIRLFHQLTNLLNRGGFHLTKWICNSDAVMQMIPPDEQASGNKVRDLESSHIERALGVQWDVQLDVFKFQICVRERPTTRRGILSVMSSIYDPLGFITPVVLPVKQMLQDLCRQGIGWDNPISQQYVTRWKNWLSELPGLGQLSIDRCMIPKDFGEIVNK